MSTNEDTKHNGVDKTIQPKQQTPTKRKHEQTVHQFRGSGMTPSIISTINNTNPIHPPLNHSNVTGNNNNNTNSLIRNSTNNRRTNEPYESYIEDSFVGHWEHEDDGYEYQEEFDAESQDGCEQDKSELHHPSTIEFDFDSFGPESIIYSPTNTAHSKSTTSGTTATTRPPTLVEVSPEAERADEVPVVCINEPAYNETTGKLTPSRVPTDDLILQTRALNINRSPDNLIDMSQIDLKLIEPYKKVISHAGYCHHYDPSAPTSTSRPSEPAPAVIVFSACYLPDRSRRDYNYVMDQLFLYVLASLHELIADDYILIYLHNTKPPNQSSSSNSSDTSPATGDNQNVSNNLPTFNWMKRCYQMIDRKLRKNLKILYLVKPTFWLKTIVIMSKPFISAKFSRKLRFVDDIDALRRCLPVDKLVLPASADNI